MNPQKIALFGNSGETTRQIVTEALRRGHNITAIVYNEKYFTLRHPNLKVVSGDVRKNYEVSKLTSGYDVVICTHEPSQANPREHIYIIRSVIEGVKDSGVHHIIFAAHRIEYPIERTEEAYDEFKPILKAGQEALSLLKNETGFRWGYVRSVGPEGVLQAGKYGTGNEILFTAPEGEHPIREDEYSSVIIDKIEKRGMILPDKGQKQMIELNI
jgi:putative NADH-flavin reductase